VVNEGPSKLAILYLRYGGGSESYVLSGGEEVVLATAKPRDRLVLRAEGLASVTVTVKAVYLERGLLPLSLLGFASFMVGAALTTTAVLVKLLGVEEQLEHAT
jgi:hypothetical protein